VADKTNLKFLVLGIVFGILVGTPSLASANEGLQNENQALRGHLVETLKLSGYKAKTFMETDEKYDRIRQEAIERINKSEDALEKLLSGEKPDEGKLKELIAVIASDQDILVNTYKLRRDETMRMLTPVQQGKYLLATWRWQQKLLQKYGKQKTGPKQGQEKKKAQ
jgi:hypothetical protein